MVVSPVGCKIAQQFSMALPKKPKRWPENLWKLYREDCEAVSECADLLNYWPEEEGPPEGAGSRQRPDAIPDSTSARDSRAPSGPCPFPNHENPVCLTRYGRITGAMKSPWATPSTKSWISKPTPRAASGWSCISTGRFGITSWLNPQYRSGASVPFRVCSGAPPETSRAAFLCLPHH